MKRDTRATIPNNLLKNQRLKKQWTQAYVAKMVGTTYVTMCRWENGITIPSLYYRKRLCELFDTSPQELGFDTLNEETYQAIEQTAMFSSTLWNVPFRRNPFFTGREETLIGLYDALHSTNTTPLGQTQAISGLAGIGKTQVAVEYAYRFRHMYQAVLWTRAETHDTLINDFVILAELLQLEEKDDHNQRNIVKAVKHWFDISTDWLLILDNIEDFTLLSDFLPSEPKGGHIVLTTRTQSMGIFARRIELDPLKQSESVLFLLRRSKCLTHGAAPEQALANDRIAAETLSTQLAGLPLALDQAGAYIEETGCSLSNYLDHYQSRQTDLLKRRGLVGLDHPQSVTTTFSFCFEKVRQANSAAAELLQFCAFLDVDSLSEQLILESATELGTILQPVAKDILALDEAFAILLSYSLVRRNTATKTFTMHRLVQTVIWENMESDTRELWARRVVSTISNLALLYVAQERYEQAKPLLQKALVISERVLGKEHPHTATRLHHLGMLLALQERYGLAEELLQRALQIREKALEVEHPCVAQTLYELAKLYTLQAKYNVAQRLFQQTLAIQEKFLDPYHPDVVATMGQYTILLFATKREAEAMHFLSYMKNR